MGLTGGILHFHPIFLRDTCGDVITLFCALLILFCTMQIITVILAIVFLYVYIMGVLIVDAGFYFVFVCGAGE